MIFLFYQYQDGWDIGVNCRQIIEGWIGGNVGDIKNWLKSESIIDDMDYVRFKGQIGKEEFWIDVWNDAQIIPLYKANLIWIKIVKLKSHIKFVKPKDS